MTNSLGGESISGQFGVPAGSPAERTGVTDSSTNTRETQEKKSLFRRAWETTLGKIAVGFTAVGLIAGATLAVDRGLDGSDPGKGGADIATAPIAGPETPGATTTTETSATPPDTSVATGSPEVSDVPVDRLEQPVPRIEQLTLANESLRDPTLPTRQILTNMSPRLSAALTHGSPLSDLFFGGEYALKEKPVLDTDRYPIFTIPNESQNEEGAKMGFGDVLSIVKPGRSYVAEFRMTREAPMYGPDFNYYVKIFDPTKSESTVTTNQRLGNTFELIIKEYDSSTGQFEKQWYAPFPEELGLTFIPDGDEPKEGMWRFTPVPKERR